VVRQKGGSGQLAPILLWLGVTALGAAVLVTAARGRYGAAVANGVAGGLLFSIGDISTKVATQGGARVAFALVLVAAYSVGPALLQIGYQAGAALTVAGLATLVTNALQPCARTRAPRAGHRRRGDEADRRGGR
jgi:hypothetical protein